MSSSPSPQSGRQAPAIPARQQEACEYRQTTYHDGSSIQIEESRRRSYAARKVEPPVQTYDDFVLYPMENERPYPQDSFGQVSEAPPAPRGRAPVSSEGHVISAKHASRGRSKPVVLHRSAKSSKKMMFEGKGGLQSSAGPAPPPPPRLGRLPTPELSDLDKAPFCECGGKSHVVRFCTGCGLEVDPWSA